MKNKKFLTLFILCSFLINPISFAEELNIKSSKININKESKNIIFDGSVSARDEVGNKLLTEKANYFKSKDLLITVGETKIITSENYLISGSNVSFDNRNKTIFSNNFTKIQDTEGNIVFLDKFNYSTSNKLFTSRGGIKLKDINNNEYQFSEIFIDEKQKKIIGSDVRSYLNQESIKINEDNEPRFFGNSFELNNNISQINKGVFTYCKERKDDKCPPWELRAKKIKHNSSNKTIYYENATLKVFDFPIFYFPKFAHPDPTVDRRSGVLVPTLNNSTTVGTGLNIPYFWAISNSKDLTLTPRIYNKENPILFAEYRQDFLNSFLIIDSSYTNGYKKKSIKKSEGSRTHFYSKFYHNFSNDEDLENNLELKVEKVSNDTYLKIHDIDTTLADKDANVLENSLNYSYLDEDLFFGINVNSFENLKVTGNNRYEYLFPYVTFGKNLIADEKKGIFDLSTKMQVRNFDVDKQTEFFINDIDWKSPRWLNNFGIENQLLSKIKTVNYKAQNTEKFKTQGMNSEISGAIGYLSKLKLYKNNPTNTKQHLLTPKLLMRYAPGHMRNINDGRLRYSNLFELNKVDEIDVLENGLSTSIGLDYKRNKISSKENTYENEFSLSLGQVISEKENSDMPASTSLDQRFSDLVGDTEYKINENVAINYSFAVDQNYKDINYNDVGLDFFNEYTKFNIAYLEEKNHIGNEEYVNIGLDINVSDSGELSFDTKRNLLTHSAEFYNISYNYINDCLKAGIIFRREFYHDRDIEPDNSIFFKITLAPLGELNTPKFKK